MFCVQEVARSTYEAANQSYLVVDPRPAVRSACETESAIILPTTHGGAPHRRVWAGWDDVSPLMVAQRSGNAALIQFVEQAAHQ
ncbi:MAG: hypothetical protein ABI862_04175 [Ilumatobacteraceae bacterium]